MAIENKAHTITLRAPTTAFSARQFYMVRADTTEGYFRAGSSAVKTIPIGVLQDAPTVAGEPCELVTLGISKLVVGSTKLGPGDRFISGANGVALSTATVGVHQVVAGQWLSAAASTGTVGYGYFNPGSLLPTTA